MKKKTNIKECIDGDAIDLSMIDLQEVPVKEIAAFPKIKNLDVSNNSISQLSDYFSLCLTHITKLDMSHNKLTCLPDNFGSLVNLRYLDLSKNQVATVPLSFGELRLLTWLDMSANPLVPKIAEVVGVCVSPAHCHAAARKLVAFMAEINKRVLLEKKRIKQVKQIQAEQAELELLKKKEKKDKKKKKKLLKSMENGNGKNEIHDLANDEFMQQQIHSYSQVSRKSKSNIVWRFLAKLFKICFYIGLFSFFTFFVIRLIDEPTYRMLKGKASRWGSSAWQRLPRVVTSVYSETVKVCRVYSRVMWRRLAELGDGLIVASTHSYRWLQTDETVQLYVDSLSHFSYALYIQFMDITTNLYLKFNDWLQS